MEILANWLLKDLFSEEPFAKSSAKGGFLTGGKVLVCESRGLQEYLKKTCVDKYGIWTALPFKPLAGLLMQCAYNLSPPDQKKDEKDNVYNPNNLVWAIYSLLPGAQQTFSLASEIASLFLAYQIYRPKLISSWTEGKAYKIQDATGNFAKNEEWQRELWGKLKEKYGCGNISHLYESIKIALENKAAKKDFLPKQIFVFAPLSIAPIQLEALTLLAKAGCKVNLYLHMISKEYIGDAKSDKSLAGNKIGDFNNRLIANLGRSAQVLYEQIGWENLEYIDELKKADSLLEKIQANIINDSNEATTCKKDRSLTLNSCFSPLREIEVLYDYLLDLFKKDKKNELKLSDIAVVAPDIEVYASAIETVFSRENRLPYKITDYDIKKYDKTVQLLNLLFSIIGTRYEAPDVIALFEYSRFVQNRELSENERERLEKWVMENAIRHGLEKSGELPNYSFESGFNQLAAGFFMISKDGFSEKKEYCYPDIEGNSAYILGDFIRFVKTLKEFEKRSKKEHKYDIPSWDVFLKDNLQVFFGHEKTDFNEDKDTPYQKVTAAWDSLREEMKTGFGNENASINFPVLKSALLKKIESRAKRTYSLSGRISFSNIDTFRGVPLRVICCIGMNSKEFPPQVPSKDISLIAAKYEPGDSDAANESRLIFLETILCAKEALYISWIGQSEKTAEELEPSGVVVMLLKNLEEQYGNKDLVAKHPLQPFSRKYFEEGFDVLNTYDNRWKKPEGKNDSKSIWEWVIESDDEEKRDIDALFRILSDAPKYFLRDVCKIELPKDVELPENMEPFVVEKGLDEWKLADMILNSRDMETAKLRGELPSGKFADKIIKLKTEQVNEMKKLEEKGIKTFIKPSRDKGKYRLWHWLQHLEHNRAEKNADTHMILLDKEGKKPAKHKLLKLQKKDAEAEINRLWGFADELKTKMQPIFPDVAWEYLLKKDLNEAEKGIFGDDYKRGIAEYSSYAEKILEGASSFEEIADMKENFKKYSEGLFENYGKYLEEE